MALVIALPTLLILIVPVRRTPWWPQLWKNVVLFAAAIAVALATSFAMFSRLAPLVRNNMHLRYIVNPIAGFTSAATVTLGPLLRRSKALVPIGAGVALGPSYATAAKPPLLVVVVGETARADHFSLNGYGRDTNPELAKAGVFSFHDVRSCGTDTRDSLPCMFSPLGKAAFEKRKAEHENLLDLLQAAGLAVLWLENQSGCKDVCDRVPVQSTADLPAESAARLCDGGECRDDALLIGLDARLARLPEERRRKGIVLVMHQMGSHGPAYYKRSAPAQKRFLPECTNTTLGQCDPQQLINAYDNTIVATDRFLAETIAWLKGRSAGHATALLYMSDHGESLGEHGIFLHGLPYSFAPEVQKRVPFVAWLGAELAAVRRIETACVGRLLDTPYSHDNLYHSVLGLLDVTTPTYRRELDTFAPCRRAAGS
jgi:lipid A ethanolaminephosphotransferase